MPTLDKYAPYILAAYGVAIVALGGLVLWTVWRARVAKQKLDAAEAASSETKPGETKP